jgi:hypothetical protein
MCGLIGYSGTENFDPEKIKVLLLYNMSRGEDSSGYYTKEDGLNKEAGKLIEHLHNYKLTPSKTLMAHTRYGTTGLKNKDNSHPFEYDKVVGCHNGKIENWTQLCWDKRFNLTYKDMNVDSQVLVKLLNDVGPKTAIPACKGPIATLFVDKGTPDILNVFRNADRPLYRGKIGSNTYISSIKESLEAINCTGIKEFKEQQLYLLENGEVKEHIKIQKYQEEVKKETKTTTTTTVLNPQITHFAYKYSKTQLIHIPVGWYEVTKKTDKFYTIRFNNMLREVSTDCFRGSQYLTKNDRMVAMTSFTFENKDVCTEGDIVLFKEYTYDKLGNVWYLKTSTNLTTGDTRSYKCPVSWFREYIEELDGDIATSKNKLVSDITASKDDSSPTVNYNDISKAKFKYGDVVKCTTDNDDIEWKILDEGSRAITYHFSSGFMYEVKDITNRLQHQANYFYERELELVRKAIDDNSVQLEIAYPSNADRSTDPIKNTIEEVSIAEHHLEEIEEGLKEIDSLLMSSSEVNGTLYRLLSETINKTQDALASCGLCLEEVKDKVLDLSDEEEEDDDSPLDQDIALLKRNEEDFHSRFVY